MTAVTPSRESLLACPFCGSSNVDSEGWSTLPQYAKTPEERSGPACDDCGATAPSAKIWNTRLAAKPADEGISRKALEMRNAIDMIEGALMRWPELMDLPEKWATHGAERHRRDLGLRDIKGTCGQLYDVYDALGECTRIINSDEYDPKDLSTTEEPKR